MIRFSIIFKRFVMCYIVLLLALSVFYFFTHYPFVLGLIIGTLGSLINTYIVEYYLVRAQDPETHHVSTGSMWRYLVAALACMVWVFYQEHVNIFGVLVGLLVSYILMILRPLYNNAS